MPMPSEQSESENAYVLDAESATEMVRLTKQDQIITKYMQGLLPEGIDPAGITAILDIACGPGGWALDVAYEYPKIQVVGIDISRNSIEYARARAKTQGLENNATFKVMDATKPLDFPDNSFDFVNARFLIGFMLPPAWPQFMQQCMRITRPGGTIRLIECEDMGNTNSPAFEKLWMMCARGFSLARRSFSPEGRNFNVTPMLGQFLQDAGCRDIKIKAYVIDYSMGTEAYTSMFENWMAGLHLLQPFLIKMGLTNQEEADELYQKALVEMMSDGFRALWYFLSVNGQKPF